MTDPRPSESASEHAARCIRQRRRGVLDVVVEIVAAVSFRLLLFLLLRREEFAARFPELRFQDSPETPFRFRLPNRLREMVALSPEFVFWAKQLDDNRYETRIAGTHMIAVPRCVLRGRGGWVAWRRYVLHESIMNEPLQHVRAFIRGPVRRRLFHRARSARLRNCFSLLSDGGHNYYHWILESLPRLKAFEMLSPDDRGDVTILVPGDSPPWVRDSFQAAGHDWQRAFHHVHDVVHVTHLYLASHLRSRPSWFLDPHSCCWLRQRVWSAYGLGTFGQPVRRDTLCVYVSRERARSRAVANERDVQDLIRAHGGIVAHLEEMTFEQQVRLFYNATLVVGMHGAGLSNVVFSRRCHLIEFMTQPPRLHFWSLANIMGHRHSALSCESHHKGQSAPLGSLERYLRLHMARTVDNGRVGLSLGVP